MNAQADLNLGWAHISEGTVSDIVAEVLSYFQNGTEGKNYYLQYSPAQVHYLPLV